MTGMTEVKQLEILQDVHDTGANSLRTTITNAEVNINVDATIERAIASKFPLTLNAAGAQRVLGTISLLVTGIGGSSSCRGTISWKGYR
jgi:hypothetical protein